jgi:catechol-2,3-dioxygenase
MNEPKKDMNHLVDRQRGQNRQAGKPRGRRRKSIYFFDQDGNRLELYWESPEWQKQWGEMVRSAFGDSKGARQVMRL